MANRRIGLNQQSAYGSITKVPEKYMGYQRFNAEPNMNKELIETSEYRLPRYVSHGGFVGTTTMSNPAAPDNIGHFLKGVTGSVSSGVADNTVYLHEFTFAQELDPFSIEWNLGLTGVDALFIRDNLIRRFTLEAPRGGACTYEWEGQYGYEETDTGTNMGTLPSLPNFTFAGAQLSYDGSNLASVEAIRFTVDNTIPDGTHDVGSQFLQAAVIDGLDLVTEVDLKFNTTQEWQMRKAMYGGDLAQTSPQEFDGTAALIIYLIGSATGEGTVTNYRLYVTLPAVTITENPHESEGRSRETQRFTCRALHDAGNKIELWNKVTSYA